MEWSISIDLLTLSDWLDIDIRIPRKSGKDELQRIDIVDAVIASAIHVYNKNPKLTHDEETGMCVWIDHSYLIEQFPLLRLEKKTLEKRLKKMIKLDLLERKTVLTRKGKRSFYRLSDTYFDLQDWHKSIIGAEKQKNHVLIAKLLDLKPEIKLTTYRVKGQCRDDSGRFKPVDSSSHAADSRDAHAAGLSVSHAADSREYSLSIQAVDFFVCRSPSF